MQKHQFFSIKQTENHHNLWEKVILISQDQREDLRSHETQFKPTKWLGFREGLLPSAKFDVDDWKIFICKLWDFVKIIGSTCEFLCRLLVQLERF